MSGSLEGVEHQLAQNEKYAGFLDEFIVLEISYSRMVFVIEIRKSWIYVV